MTSITIISDTQREYARQCVTEAPPGYVVTISEDTRTKAQNRKLWALLGDISKAEPMGRKHTPEDWKCIFMRALKYEIRFVQGLDDSQFPVGFSSSKLTVPQMSELIEYANWFCAENGVVISERGTI